MKPGVSRPGVSDLGGGTLRVAVRERAVEGQANDAVRRALAEHFGVRLSAVSLVKGLKSRKKTFEIEGHGL